MQSHRLIFRLSVALKSKGFAKGDKLHIVCNNNIYYHALMMAVWRLGGVVSCGDTALNADTIQYQIKEMQVVMLANLFFGTQSVGSR